MDLKEWRRLAVQSVFLFLMVLAVGIFFSGHQSENSGNKIQAAAKKEEPIAETAEPGGEEKEAVIAVQKTVKTAAKKKKQTVKSAKKKEYKHVIVLDAGHGGMDEGTVSVDWKYSEKNYTLTFAKRLKSMLEEKNIKVYLTRTEDIDMTKKARVAMANRVKPEIFVSIHCNAAEEWERSADGLETLYSEKKPHYGRISNKKLADILLEELVKASGREKRGTIVREGLYLLRHSEVPTVIAEVGYMTNASDMQFLLSKSGQDMLVKGLYNGILKALGEKTA